MKICPSCGAIANDDVNICSTCGYSLSQIASTNLATGQQSYNNSSAFAGGNNNNFNNYNNNSFNNTNNNFSNNNYANPVNSSVTMDSVNNITNNSFNNTNNFANNSFDSNSMNTANNSFNNVNNFANNSFDSNSMNTANNSFNNANNFASNGFDNNNFGNNTLNPSVGSFNPPAGQHPWHPADMQKPKKKIPKKVVLLFLAIIIAISAAGFGIYAIVMSAKGDSGLTKREEKQIRNSINEYAENINKLDAKKVAEATVPTELIKELLTELSYEMGDSSFSEYADNFDSYYNMALSAISVGLSTSNTKVSITNLEIGAINKVDLFERLDNLLSSYGDLGTDADEIVDIITEVKASAQKVGIDLDQVYSIDVSFDLDVTVSGESQSLPDGITINHMYAYKYKNKFYLIPGFEDILSSSLAQYTNKAKKSSDISDAHSIIIAVQVVLSNEKNYSYLTTDMADQVIEVSEEGFKKIDSSVAEELLNAIGEYPEVNYKEDGQKHFTFKVSKDGEVSVYISNSSDPEAWEILPDLSPEYK